MSKKRFLVIVDPQNDFIEGGSLAVEGAKKAMSNLAAYIKNHNQEFDHIFVSLDTHNSSNLGFKENWTGPAIESIQEYQPFPVDDLRAHTIFPKFMYTREEDVQTVLAQPGFMCWPKHCVKGTQGHKIYEALQNELFQISDKVTYLTKGEDDAKDNYSIFHYGDGSVTRHANPFKLWDKFDYPEVYVAGLALDFCVFETIKSMQKLDKNADYTLLISMSAAIQNSETVTKLYESLDKKVNIKI